MKVMVTGAAGYIGTHVARTLVEAGHEVVRVDRAPAERDPLAGTMPIVRASVGDAAAMDRALEGCDAIAHLAGSALVGESVERPLEYWRNNLAEGVALVEQAVRRDIRSLVFASSCAVYGIPDAVPIREDAPKAPISPYGHSKLAFERVLAASRVAHGLRSTSLRFFNAAGAHERGDIGERHEPETHIIPLVLGAIATGGTFTLHGDDFPTSDGTCVRDYIDVRDLARAHVLALDALAAGSDLPEAMNLGHGKGSTNREVIAACEEVTGSAVRVAVGPRRAGDPPALVAHAQLARQALGFEPRHALRDMVSSAWRFMQGSA